MAKKKESAARKSVRVKSEAEISYEIGLARLCNKGARLNARIRQLAQFANQNWRNVHADDAVCNRAVVLRDIAHHIAQLANTICSDSGKTMRERRLLEEQSGGRRGWTDAQIAKHETGGVVGGVVDGLRESGESR